jgi:hypothetical protein
LHFGISAAKKRIGSYKLILFALIKIIKRNGASKSSRWGPFIYSKAKRIIIRLGEATDDTDYVMHYMKQLEKQREKEDTKYASNNVEILVASIREYTVPGYEGQDPKATCKLPIIFLRTVKQVAWYLATLISGVRTEHVWSD